MNNQDVTITDNIEEKPFIIDHHNQNNPILSFLKKICCICYVRPNHIYDDQNNSEQEYDSDICY